MPKLRDWLKQKDGHRHGESQRLRELRRLTKLLSKRDWLKHRE